MGWIIVWLLLSILAGWVASQNNRSFVAYFIMSILLSPLVTFIVLIALGKNEKEVETSLQDDDNDDSIIVVNDTEKWNEIVNACKEYADKHNLTDQKRVDFLFSATDGKCTIKTYMMGNRIFVKPCNEELAEQIKKIAGIKTEQKQERNGKDDIEKLIELSKLYEKGLLTKEEFEKKKQELI